MSGETYLVCSDERRRHAVRAAGNLNGLDYLEVSEDQLTLTVYFLGQAPEAIGRENVRIEGGRRVQLRVTGLHLCLEEDPELDDCMRVTVDQPGDFSTYTLCLVEVDERGEPTGRPFPGFDRRYSCLRFSFKAGCASGLDCAAGEVCPPERRAESEINYLAKDYASFRQLLLDRLALLLPEWRERHVPDVGIALVELLAYAGDHLSYFQDAVATEAYLDTARRRISVRRHVRLVDYPMHEGCNARAWVSVATDQEDREIPPQDLFFVTRYEGAPQEAGLLPAEVLAPVPAGLYEVFEPLVADPRTPLRFRRAHNEIRFYTWGDGECCLARGAARATLVDRWLDEAAQPDPPGYGAKEHCPPPEPPKQPPHRRRRALDLRVGDVLLFAEVIGPRTGDPDDADPSHRHAVRLTAVTQDVDSLDDTPVVEIEWAAEDALPFPLCLSVVGPAVGPSGPCARIDGVSVARGNVVLVDHGRRLPPETLGPVEVEATVERCEGEGRPSEVREIAALFRPSLARGPLVYSEPVDPELWAAGASAASMVRQDPRRALPALEVAEGWSPRRDLLASGPGDLDLAVEVDEDGRALLRFGDGELGRRPEAGATFQVTYRIGGGPAGNVGAEAIAFIVPRQTLSGLTLTPRNPLPARGGTAPETVAEVRLLAPHVFREEIERAVTADDYARIVEREFAGRVVRAAAALRWTGSGDEVLVAVDLPCGREDAALLREIAAVLECYRRIGHDVVVAPAVQVPLSVRLDVCVRPSYLRGHVEADLRQTLGRHGFFDPDNLSFGEGIAASRLIAAAWSVTGVESVRVTRLERLHEGPNGELEAGLLPLGPLEIARLDGDPRFPENGRLDLSLRGGR